MKTCDVCQENKKLTEFHLHKAAKDRLKSKCKSCRKLESQNFYIKNKDKINKRRRQYYIENIEAENNRKSIYKRKHLEKVRNAKRIYENNRYHSNLEHRLASNLRSRLRSALLSQKTYKNNTTIELTSISIDKLIKYLENKFQKDMSWGNYGEWHIDHIKPLSKFDLNNKDQLRKACHYTNLQPLWAGDNYRKGKNYDKKDV